MCPFEPLSHLTILQIIVLSNHKLIKYEYIEALQLGLLASLVMAQELKKQTFQNCRIHLSRGIHH